MINSITLIGRLGKDPELRTTEKGKSMVTFPIAHNEYRQINGERQQMTHWFNCVAFGTLAEICSEFIHRGARVGIHGALKQRKFITKEGENRSVVEILLRDVEFLSTNGSPKSSEEDEDE